MGFGEEWGGVAFTDLKIPVWVSFLAQIDRRFGMDVRIRTRLSVPACLGGGSCFREFYATRLVVLHHYSAYSVHRGEVECASTLVYRLQTFSLPPTHVHNLVLEPLLALVTGAFGHRRRDLVTARHPRGNASLRRIPPHIRIYTHHQRIVRSFQRGSANAFGNGAGEYLVEACAQFVLVQVA